MSDSPIERAQAVLDEVIKVWSMAPLRSIFSLIGDKHQPPTYLRPERLRLDIGVLSPTSEHHQPTLSALHQQFTQALETCSAQQPIKLHQTLSLLADYGWAVASREEAVSLYDYARTHAALAAVGDKALLLGGDISGVQDFIYTIAADKATKSLRGRSVYLQLLTEAIAYWILDQAKMPATNLIYSGGGRFYLVLPNDQGEHVDRWRRELGTLLLNVHAGELYVALGTATIDTSDFNATFRAVNEATNHDKRRRFAALDSTTLYETLFMPEAHDGNEEHRCVVCGYAGESSAFLVIPEEDRNPQIAGNQYRCQLCESLIDLGKHLHNAWAIVRLPCTPEPQHKRTKWHQVLKALGSEIWVVNNQRSFEQAMRSGAIVQLIRADDPRTDLDLLRREYTQAAFEFRPIVNVTPYVTEADGTQRPIYFHEMAQTSKGINRFGVLRMDVDDLGDIFAYSLKDMSLERVSALSSALSRFFEGWVGEICRSENANNQVYSVYSGGDDLFLVGSWDVLPTIADMIQRDLQRYTGNNRLIHVSAGITLHSEKFPLYQAAKQADDALKQAKNAPTRGGISKNSLNFLEQTVAWECFEPLDTLRKELEQQTHDEKAFANALLQTLMDLYSQYRKGLERKNKAGTRQFFFGPWIWRGRYQLRRIRDKAPENHKQIIKEWEESLIKGVDQEANITARFIEQAGLAARWTQLRIRTKGERNG